jgi:hypothetical protein
MSPRLAALALDWLISLAAIAIYVYGIIKARKSVRALRPLDKLELQRSVTVIVPARNEEGRIRWLAESLSRVPVSDVILVDDQSNDRTVEVAMSYLRGTRLRVIRVDGTPWGWLPKPYAVELGASRAGISSSLLFLDADVSGDLGPVLAAASSVRPGELVAFEPRFTCTSGLCRLTQPFLTSIVHGFFGFDRALNPRDRHSMMFGCCWSIDPYSFWESGGMAQVRQSVVEDRTLAVKLKERGFRLTAYDAREHLRVMSWDDAGQFVNLVRRVSYSAAAGMSMPSYLAFSAGVALLMLWPFAAIPMALLGPFAALGPLLTYAAQAAFAAVGQRVEGISGTWFLASPLAGALVTWGFISSRLRPISWKGRLLGQVQGNSQALESNPVTVNQY